MRRGFSFLNICLLLTILGLGFSYSLWAGEINWPNEELVKAEILLATKDFSQPFSLGLRFELKPGWHLYWVNPGDAGLPPDVKWILPPRLKPGPLLFPVPDKFTTSGLVTYGYEREVVLLCTLTPEPGFSPDSEIIISATIDWMVCQESCITGTSRTEIKPASLTEEKLRQGQELMNYYRQRLPLSPTQLRLSWKEIKLTPLGHKALIEATGEGPGWEQVIDFYPLPMPEGTVEHGEIRLNQGRLFIPLMLFDPAVLPPRLRGLLIVRSGNESRYGYEVEIPLPRKGENFNHDNFK